MGLSVELPSSWSWDESGSGRLRDGSPAPAANVMPGPESLFSGSWSRVARALVVGETAVGSTNMTDDC